MIVKEILFKNKNKSIVCFEEGVAFVLYKGDFNKYHISPGEEMPQNEYEELIREVLPKRALNRSYKLLLSRDYTVKQIRDKLSGDGYPADIIDSVIEQLKEMKYLDDSRFAENYIFWKSQNKSRNRLILDLRQRGISGETAQNLYEELLEKNDIDPEEKVIRDFLNKKGFDVASSSYEEKEKMRQTLIRKGFSFDSIGRILGRGEY